MTSFFLRREGIVNECHLGKYVCGRDIFSLHNLIHAKARYFCPQTMSDCPYDTTDVDMTDLTANLFAKVSIGKPESGGEETDASYLPTTAIEDPSSADIQMVGPSEIFSSQITSTGHVEESGSKPQDRAQDREMLTDAGKLDHMKDTEDWSRAANALLEYIEAPGTVESTVSTRSSW